MFEEERSNFYNMMREFPDTQAHIFLATRELLLSAIGVLRFCKTYVEEMSTDKPHPNLIQFFSKAIAVASDMGADLVKTIPVKQASQKLMQPLCDMLEKEMNKKKTNKSSKSTKSSIKKTKTKKRTRK